MSKSAPDALLFIAPGCPHCPRVLDALGELLKEGVIGRLEAINVAEKPDMAAAQGVRSAPWTRIGGYELPGARSAEELRNWAERAADETGGSDYLRELLEAGRLDAAEQRIADQQEPLQAVLPLLADPEAPLQLRLGAGALLESWADRPELAALVTELGQLATHSDHRVRADACHYLGLSGDPAARPYLEERLEDEAPEVREIAAEALERLAA